MNYKRDLKFLDRRIVHIALCFVALFIAWESFEFVYAFFLHYFKKVWSVEVHVAFYIWVLSVISLIIVKSKLKWITFLLAPYILIPICRFLGASADYFQNKAAIYVYTGRDMSLQEFGLDRNYRAWRRPEDREALWGYPLKNAEKDRMDERRLIYDTHNDAIKFWTKLFGYQKGVYQGVFPIKDVADNYVETKGVAVDLQIHGGDFDTPDDSVYITFVDKERTIKLSCNSYSPCFIYWLLTMKNLNFKVASLNDQLWILKTKFTLLEEDKSTQYFICLADKSNGLIIQTYSSLPKI